MQPRGQSEQFAHCCATLHPARSTNIFFFSPLQLALFPLQPGTATLNNQAIVWGVRSQVEVPGALQGSWREAGPALYLSVRSQRLAGWALAPSLLRSRRRGGGGAAARLPDWTPRGPGAAARAGGWREGPLRGEGTAGLRGGEGRGWWRRRWGGGRAQSRHWEPPALLNSALCRISA